MIAIAKLLAADDAKISFYNILMPTLSHSNALGYLSPEAFEAKKSGLGTRPNEVSVISGGRSG